MRIDLDFPVLIGDIGGTNSRLGLIRDAHSELELFQPVKTDDYADLQSLVEDVVFSSTSIAPKRLVIGIAAPIVGSRYKLTNAKIKVHPQKCVADLRLTSAEFMNDFPAQALGVLTIKRRQMQKVGGGRFKKNATRIVVGPGTSFGVATLVHTAGSWTILPAEGAVADLALGTGYNAKRELRIQSCLNKKLHRQTIETLISGPGLENLYQAICRANNTTGNLSAAQISAAAKTSGDKAAKEAVKLFSSLLGRVSGNLALGALAYGGVYLTGGMAHKMLQQIKAGDFRREFEHKEPHRALAERIPTYFVNRENAALEGLANYVRTPDRFDLSHASAHYYAR